MASLNVRSLCAPHAHEGVRQHRLIAARRARRAGRGSCARVSASAQSADEYEPSWAHWLPQQPTLSRLKGSRQARAEQAHARGRGTGFEAVEASSAPLTTTMARTAQGDPRRKRTSNHPASWVASHQGRVRFMVRLTRSATLSVDCVRRGEPTRPPMSQRHVRCSSGWRARRWRGFPTS